MASKIDGNEKSVQEMLQLYNKAFRARRKTKNGAGGDKK